MNRSKKIITNSSDEDEKVSIFDSEDQQSPKQKTSQAQYSATNSQKMQQKYIKDNNNMRNKRTYTRNKQKQLRKDEAHIMSIMNNAQIKNQVKEEITSQVQLRQSSKDQLSSRSVKKQAYQMRCKQQPAQIVFKKQNRNQTASNNNLGQQLPQSDNAYEQELNLQDFQYLNEDNNKRSTISMNNNKQYSQSLPNQYPVQPLYRTDKIDTQQLMRLSELVQKQNGHRMRDDNQVRSTVLKRRRMFVFQEMERLRVQYQEIGKQLDGDSQSTMKDLTERYKTSPQQLTSLLKQWKFDPNYTKRRHKKVDVGTDRLPKSKSQSRIQMLQQVISQNPFLTQAQMAQVLRARDPVLNARIQRSVVLRLLKSHGYKKKKVRWSIKEKNTPQLIQHRFIYAHKYRELCAQQYSVFYYDQLLISQYFDKESGWCRADGQVDFKQQCLIDRSIVVLAVLSSSGACRWDVKFSDYEPQQYATILSNMLKSAGHKTQKRALVVNPLPYRNPQWISQVTSSRGWQMLVLPSQGFGLNPLQSYFAELREMLKRKRAESIEGLFEQVVQLLRESDRMGQGRKMTQRVEMFVERALAKEAF